MEKYEEAQVLINIGPYVNGNDPKIDRAIRVINPLVDFMRQKIDESSNLNEDLDVLEQILQLNATEKSQVNEEIQV